VKEKIARRESIYAAKNAAYVPGVGANTFPKLVFMSVSPRVNISKSGARDRKCVYESLAA